MNSLNKKSIKIDKYILKNNVYNTWHFTDIYNLYQAVLSDFLYGEIKYISSLIVPDPALYDISESKFSTELRGST